MEESWHAARLIPTSGINGADEQERRGTSALMAVLGSVKEFGRTITTRLGAPVGVIETYIEVPFDLDGQRRYPDGLIRVTRGSKVWTCLVEVKTGKNDLAAPQLEAYLDIAREEGFQAVLTISNQIPVAVGSHPCPVDKRKLRRVDLKHLSWSQIHTEAIVEKANRAVSDPDQAWILSELIRYLEHPKSGAVDFDDMGPHWVSVRDSVRNQTIRGSDQGVSDVCAKFEQLVRFCGMQLGRQLGTDVQPALSRKEINEPALRLAALAEQLCGAGLLTGALKVPNTVGVLNLAVDLRAATVTASVDVDAPREGRPSTRVNWLLRQLRDSPDQVRIDTFVLNGRGSNRSELLSTARTEPGLLIDSSGRDLRLFRVALTRPMGSKRGQGKGAFVSSVTDLVDVYEAVVGRLKPWSAPPPKLRHPDEETEPEVAPELVSTALSSQDETEPTAEADTETPAFLDGHHSYNRVAGSEGLLDQV